MDADTRPPNGAARPAATAEPWRRRLARTLLYGRDVDRAAKASARHRPHHPDLRDRLFGDRRAAGDVRGRARRSRRPPWRSTTRWRQRGPTSSTATARCWRPTCARPSLFGEPHRIIDVDEASELLTAVVPELDAPELRERLGSKRRFVWLKREITPQQREQIHRLGLPGIGFLPENKRVYPNGAEVSHVIGHVNIDNQGIAGIEKWLDKRGLADLHMAGLATDRLQKPVELAVDLRVQHALRDELIAAREKYQGDGGGRAPHRRAHRRDHRHGVGAGLRSEQSARGARSDPHQPADHRRVEMGSTFKALTLAMALDSGKIHAEVGLRRARAAAVRQVHDPRLSTRRAAC